MATRCAVYEFRMNADKLDEQSVIKQLRKIAKKFTFQLEKGEQNGYLHYQGRISLIKKSSKQALLKLFLDIPQPNYLEPTVSKESLKEAFYCLKEATKVKGPWKDSDPDIYIPSQYRLTELRPYQLNILNDNYHNDRTINFIYDPQGNKGKTTICAIASITKGYIYLPFINDYEDLMATMLCECYEITRSTTAVMLDMPRALGKERINQIYAGLETIKGG